MTTFTCPNCKHEHADTDGTGWVEDGVQHVQCAQCACVATVADGEAPVHVAPCDTCGEPTPVAEALGYGDNFLCPDCFEC